MTRKGTGSHIHKSLLRKTNILYFRKIIKEGIEKGEIKGHHPEVILFSILSTLRSLYVWYQKRGKLDVNVLKKDMVAVLLNGIVV